MRKSILFFVLFLFLGCVVIAQEAISYQAIARNTAGGILSNQTISVKFEIRQGSMTGTAVFTETHSITTNQFGLFTLAIGSVSTTQFQAINWANMPFFMEVSIDPAGGTAYASAGNQQLMSVPYALYAKTAGNAGITPTISINSPNTITTSAGSYSINVPASTTYSAGTGISISGAVITNTAVAPTPTITGTGATTVTSSGNTFTVNTPAPVAYTAGSGISITSGTVANSAPDKTVSIAAAGSATVTGAYPNFTVNVPNGTLLPNGRNGQFIYSNGTVWDTIPRAKLYFDGNNFGIGTQSPMSDFHVDGGGRFGASVTTVDVYTDNIKITGGTTGQVLTSDATGNGSWQTPVTANLTYTPGTNRLSVTQGTAVSTVTLTGRWTQGTGILYNTTQTDNVGIGTTTPGNRLDVVSTAVVSALRATNNGTGNGIEGGANSASSAGILGYNDGTGPSIAGSKSITSSAGSAGRFEIFNFANASHALVATTPGNGAAVQAINTATAIGASNLAVLVEDGHLKARFNTPITSADITIGANSLGTTNISTSSNADQSNDVRGVITLGGTYSIVSGFNESTYLTVQFKKKYKNPPIILLTPYLPPGFSDNVVITAQLVNVATTDFTFRFNVYYSISGPSYSPSQFSVSYMIME